MTELAAVYRDARRTCVITMTSTTAHDVIRVCDPECRDEFLRDLGLSGHGGGWAFRSRGEADVTVAWNHKDYRVTWKRCAPSALPCDQCGGEWRFRQERVREVLPPTEAQLASRARFAAEFGRKPLRAPERPTGAVPGSPVYPRPAPPSDSLSAPWRRLLSGDRLRVAMVLLSVHAEDSRAPCRPRPAARPDPARRAVRRDRRHPADPGRRHAGRGEAGRHRRLPGRARPAPADGPGPGRRRHRGPADRRGRPGDGGVRAAAAPGDHPAGHRAARPRPRRRRAGGAAAAGRRAAVRPRGLPAGREHPVREDHAAAGARAGGRGCRRHGLGPDPGRRAVRDRAGPARAAPPPPHRGDRPGRCPAGALLGGAVPRRDAHRDRGRGGPGLAVRLAVRSGAVTGGPMPRCGRPAGRASSRSR